MIMKKSNNDKKKSFNLKELLFTGFYSGYSPIAPGTVGTVVAMVIYFIEYLIFKESCWISNCIIVAILIYPSIKLTDDGELFFGVKDPSQIVLDEFVGYWISLLFFPFSIRIAIIAFILFRILDIIKPFPARRLQDLNGGLGIMIDDIIAGVYTNLTILLIIIASKSFKYPIYLSNQTLF